jgi:hypothetical protein
MPTSEWKAATSCGIEVMAMRRAIEAPTEPPIATPPRIRPMVRGSSLSRPHRVSSVPPTAMAMPIIPLRLPAWLVEGLDRPLSARMNRTPESR